MTTKYIAIAMALSGCVLDGADDEDAAACGNGELDADEACDDGNHDPSDGCNAQCDGENGFRCDEPGEQCAPVLGITWDGTSPSDPGFIGGNNDGGEYFVDRCQPDEVITGFIGAHADGCGASYGGIFGLSAVCSRLEMDDQHRLVAERSNPLPAYGLCDNPGKNLEVASLACPHGTVVKGVRASLGEGNDINGLELHCSPVTHQFGGILIEEDGPLGGALGEAPFDESAFCRPGMVAVGFMGSSGQRVNSALLRCARLQER